MDQLLEVEVISDDKHRGDQKDHWTKDFRKWVGMVELRRKGRHIAPGPASVPLHQLFPCLASAPRTPLPFTAEELHLISSSFMLTVSLRRWGDSGIKMRRQWDTQWKHQLWLNICGDQKNQVIFAPHGESSLGGHGHSNQNGDNSDKVARSTNGSALPEGKKGRPR